MLGAVGLALPLLLSIIGVASPPARTAVRISPRPPTAHPLTPPRLPLKQQPSSAAIRAVPAAKKASDAAAKAAAVASVKAALSGLDLVESPNVFRGISPTGELLEMPATLGRKAELELVRRALFFIAATDAQRTLTERARAAASSEGGASSSERMSDSPVPIFNHEEILAEMRRAAEDKTAKAAEARLRGKQTAQEIPCEVPEAASDTEYRLLTSMGRAAYNRLFHHHQKLIYFEVNKVGAARPRTALPRKLPAPFATSRTHESDLPSLDPFT